MNGHSEWIPNELHLPPILSRSIKPTKITLSDLNCNNLSKAVCEAPLPSDLADRSNSNPLTQYPYNNNQDALPFSQDSLLGSPQIAPQISINKSVNSVFSPAKDSIKFRPKVKHRRLATIVSSVARHGEY